MGRKRKTPEQIASDLLRRRRQDFAAVDLQPEAANLDQQSDIEVTRTGGRRGSQTARHDTARRLDAFEALRPGMAPGCYDAARRFEGDLLASLGLTSRPVNLGDRVDCERGRTDIMVLAASRVVEVRSRLPVRDFWLMHDLIAPRIDRGGWRAHVAYITGETHDHAQGAAVRAAAVNLRDVYEAMERRAA